MKTKRKIIFFVALMSLFYCVTFMQDTYAKYVSSATANTGLTIARWSILINNQDVVNESDFTETISPVFAGTENIRSDVIAPTANGYFDVIINGENTDVSFSYTITVDTSDCVVEDLQITKYSIDGVEYQYNGSAISGNIALNNQSRTRTVRFFVTWNDNAATQTMDNADDTAVVAEETAAFDISVNLIQLQ